MSQNVYDGPQFFAGYTTLDRSVKRLDDTPEQPSLQAILPPVTGLRMVDLDCDYGWFCRWAQQQEANRIAGFDVSQRMLARTREMTRGDEVVYRCADLQALTLPANSCNLVYSPLALHCLPNIAPLFATLQRALVPGGTLVFSAEHPIYTAPLQQDWRMNDQRQKSQSVNHYQQEGERVSNWFAEGAAKQHRKLLSWIDALIVAGFVLEQLDEWGPSAEQIIQQLALDKERERSMIFSLRARKPD